MTTEQTELEWKLLKITGNIDRLREEIEGIREKISFIPDCLARADDVNKETMINITNYLHRLDSIESEMSDFNKLSSSDFLNIINYLEMRIASLEEKGFLVRIKKLFKGLFSR